MEPLGFAAPSPSPRGLHGGKALLHEQENTVSESESLVDEMTNMLQDFWRD